MWDREGEMKKNIVSDYYTFNELNTLIGISLRDFIEELSEHTRFTGLLHDNNGGLFYASGIFEVMETEWPTQPFSYEEIESGSHLVEQDRPVDCRLISVSGTKGSNNNKLTGHTFKVKSYHSVDEVLFSFEDFNNIINKLGIPLIANRTELHKKKFNYDIHKVNQKTIFTLYEACSIASNIKLASIPRPMFDCELFDHNLSVMSECAKGQNQKGFHLITKELWISTTDDCYEPCSRKYNNGTTLNIDVVLDKMLTVISKNELIRWCEFMDVKTGLIKDEEVENESVEFLKVEVERLQKLVRKSPPRSTQQVPQQALQPPVPVQNNEVKLDIRTTNKTIIVSLGLMAWMLSEKTSILCRGGKPNKTRIEKAIKNAVSELDMINPDNDNHGIIVGNLERDISLGIKELDAALEK